MCYIDGQKNKYSVLNECSRMLKYNIQYILEQDGAPPHSGLQVSACLDRAFPGTWISRDGPMSWPQHSPDITPLDFSLWGYVKSIVFRTPVNGLDELKSRIRIFQRTCSTEHDKSSNFVWTLSILPREPTSRSTEVNKRLPEFPCNLLQTALVSSICLQAKIVKNPEQTLWTHCTFACISARTSRSPPFIIVIEKNAWFEQCTFH
jgi:hypothetical protein